METGKWFVFRLMALVLLSSSYALSQTCTTSLQGTVMDPSGAAVANATVVLANTEAKLERTAVTGSQGEYRFQFLPPGTYSLTVSAPGFAHYKQTELQLLVNTPATLNAQLKIGTASQSVSVTSEAPALNLVDASLGNSFDETQVRQIPLDARSPQLLSCQYVSLGIHAAKHGFRREHQPAVEHVHHSRSGDQFQSQFSGAGTQPA